MVSCSGFGLPLHAQLLRLFVTRFFQAEDGIRDFCLSRGLGDVYKRQVLCGWPALVGWRFLCVCAFDGFLLWVRIASACPTIASLCNKEHVSYMFLI